MLFIWTCSYVMRHTQLLCFVIDGNLLEYIDRYVAHILVRVKTICWPKVAIGGGISQEEEYVFPLAIAILQRRQKWSQPGTFVRTVTKTNFVIKKPGSFFCIQTNNFCFFNTLNFVAARLDYAKYLKAFEGSVANGFFFYKRRWTPLSLKKIFPRKFIHIAYRQGVSYDSNFYQFHGKYWHVCFCTLLRGRHSTWHTLAYAKIR